MNILQSLVLPNLEVRASEDMYVRLNPSAWVDLASPRIHFSAGGVASLDTYYNGLTVHVWKRHCDIDTLALRLRGEGEFVVSFGVHRRSLPFFWLDEHTASLTPGQATDLPVRGWADLVEGILFVRIRSLGGGVLEQADYATADDAPNDVRLGLVITHFNRQAQVLPAIDRIRRSVLERPDLRNRITLTVVDNSRNLTLPEHRAIEHILNRNLGGTGGFVRGLLSLIESGAHSHALFMDDDASCETESIARTYALLQYSRDPKLAIAGALLREVEPWRLAEKGARFEGHCEALASGLDMRHVWDLLEAERKDTKPHYGGWWFFAFAIAEIRQFPFPFFVRGDDVFFGLGNDFQIETLNGVACFAEDFSFKHGPVTSYLDARYHLVHAVLQQQGARSRLRWIASRLFLKHLTGYQYSSARAVTQAFRDVAQGPSFFAEHMDMQAILKEIGSWQPSEKMASIGHEGLEVRGPRKRREGRLRRLVRILTLQGFLLPTWLLKNRTTLQPKDFHANAEAVFRYRRVLYEYAPTGTGYVAVYDRGHFFAELRAFIGAYAHLVRRLPQLRRQYAEGFEQMATLDFWQRVYPGSPTGAARSAPVPQEAQPARAPVTP